MITSCALCALRNSTNVAFLCDKCWHFRNNKFAYYLPSICQSIHTTDLSAINFQSVVYFDKGIMLRSCVTIATIFAIANLFNICYKFVVKTFNRFACFSSSICHYTGCTKSVETSKYFRSLAFYKKMFQTKVVGFKMIYLLILSVWPWMAILQL